MLHKIFRTKEGIIITIIVVFSIIIISLLAVYGYVRKKSFMEQAVMAENYLNAGNYELAVEAYKKALSKNGSDKQLLTIGLAQAYAGLDEYDKALEILRAYYMKSPEIEIKEKIEEITSRKTDYEFSQVISRAEVFYSKKEYEKAILEFEKAKQIKSKDSTPYKRIAEAYILLGEYEKARDEVIEGQEITGDDKLKDTLSMVNRYLNKEQYDMLMSQAAEYILQENFKDGEKKYLEAINLLPYEAAAYVELANIYISQGKYDEALRLLSDANFYDYNQEVIDVYNRAMELKTVSDEKNKVINSLISALKKRDFNTVRTIMASSFFIENIVDETAVYINTKKEAPVETDEEANTVVDGTNLIIYDRYRLYYGNIQSGRRNGEGIYLKLSEKSKDKSYSYYDGEWSRNQPNGSGRYVEVKAYVDDEGKERENKTKTEGGFINALEDGSMTKYFYIDSREVSRLSYNAKDGVPLPLPRTGNSSYPEPKEGYYIIGELYVDNAPSGEYYSVRTGTLWGVLELIK